MDGEGSKTPGYKVAWKNRNPSRRPNKTITVRPDVWDLLNERRGERSWADFLCESVGVTPPQDRRLRAK